MSSSISRRAFVEGAALATGAAAIAGTGTVMAVAEESEAPEAAYIAPQNASARAKSFAACTYDMDQPAPIAAADVAEWADEADVVVVGLGGGLAGAARAAYLGYDVIAIDKASSFGGTSQEACQYIVFTGIDCQLKMGLPDMSQVFHDQMLSGYPEGEKYEKHVSQLQQCARDLIDWTTELGLEWMPSNVFGYDKVAYAVVPLNTEEGWNSYRILRVAEEFYDKVFTENGGRYMFSTPITGLVMDEGAVVGVQVTPDGGEPIYVKANKGVVLACGGFTNNLAMLQAYAPKALAQATINTAGIYDNGDAIRLGLGAGAQLEGYDNVGLFDGGIDGVDWNHHLYAADVQIARQPWLQVDVMGDRVHYEPLDYSGAGEKIGKMPGHRVFSFFDANWEQWCDKFVMPMCRNLSKPTMPYIDRWDGRLDPDYRNGVNQAIEEGRITSADTLEELAEKLEIPVENFLASVEAWNEMCASGDGSEWGYTDPTWLHPLDTPPFYGQSLGAMMFSTRCGLSVDENNQVIDVHGELIPGLYAGGNTAGRPYSCILGDVGHSAASCFNAVNHICA